MNKEFRNPSNIFKEIVVKHFKESLNINGKIWKLSGLTGKICKPIILSAKRTDIFLYLFFIRKSKLIKFVYLSLPLI